MYFKHGDFSVYNVNTNFLRSAIENNENTYRIHMKGEFENDMPNEVKKVYSVVLVNPDHEIVIDTRVVALTDESAKVKAGVYKHIEEFLGDFDDYTIITTVLGTVKNKK